MNTLHPKVKNAGLASAATTILIGILDRLHAGVTPVEAAALVTLVGNYAGWRTT